MVVTIAIFIILTQLLIKSKITIKLLAKYLNIKYIIKDLYLVRDTSFFYLFIQIYSRILFYLFINREEKNSGETYLYIKNKTSFLINNILINFSFTFVLFLITSFYSISLYSSNNLTNRYIKII